MLILFDGCRFSSLASFRSGFPYTVYAPSSFAILNNRADLIAAGRTADDVETPGGRRLLNPDAFQAPSPGRLGNIGRNAFGGHGMFNIDASLSRAFRRRGFGEDTRLSVRADVFNLLNHANLNNPDSVLGSTTFGIASYGRQGRDTGLPALTPWRETPRRIHVMVRLEF